MKKYILTILFSFPLFLHAQNLPQCDSLIINCCGIGNDILTLSVTNPTSVLFDYPAFALFNTNGDTIAKEEVYYFGLSGSSDPHIMTVVAPLNLPFTGYLNLYTLFYDSLDCSFPITIADTASGIYNLQHSMSVTVFPNPSTNHVTVRSNNLAGNYIQVIDLSGRKIIQTKALQNIEVLNIQFLSSGIYFLELVSDARVMSRTKLIKQ